MFGIGISAPAKHVRPEVYLKAHHQDCDCYSYRFSCDGFVEFKRRFAGEWPTDHQPMIAEFDLSSP